MAQFTKVKLSGSTNGRGIKVAATATAGTTIHATGTSATIIDEIWLYAYNNNASATRTLTIEFGGVTDPDDLIVVGVPAKSGLLLVVPGLPLNGTGSVALTVAAFADVANEVVITGFVNRITPDS